MKLEILLKPLEQFGTRNDVAIHLKNPSYSELIDSIEQAVKDMFPRIVVYSKISFWSRSNIKNGMSTWAKLIRDIDGDVRAGEVGFKHGRSDGDGFEIYLNVD